MDGEPFLNGNIFVKHAQGFTEGEKAEFKNNVEPPTVDTIFEC